MLYKQLLVISSRSSILSDGQFFSSLTGLLAKTSEKSRGSVYLTQKPLLSTGEQAETQPSILIRASDGNTGAPKPDTNKVQKKTAKKDTKIKLSTVVAPGDLEGFYTRYADVCKTGMTGLKKRDRKKGKAKTKGGAAKKA